MRTWWLLAMAVGACLGFAPLKETARAVVSPPQQPAPVRFGDRFDELILRHSASRGLDPRLVKAIIAVESEFHPQAVSPKGALGLMQVMPATGKELGVTTATLMEPDANIRIGTAYLHLLAKAWLARDDNRRGASGAQAELPTERLVAAYHAGPNALGAAKWPVATQLYVRAVLRYYSSTQSVLHSSREGSRRHSAERL